MLSLLCSLSLLIKFGWYLCELVISLGAHGNGGQSLLYQKWLQLSGDDLLLWASSKVLVHGNGNRRVEKQRLLILFFTDAFGTNTVSVLPSF